MTGACYSCSNQILNCMEVLAAGFRGCEKFRGKTKTQNRSSGMIG